MESVKELLKVVGLQGRLRTAESLRVDVLVDDARNAYGRIDYRVSPLAGEGCAWVASGPRRTGGDAMTDESVPSCPECGWPPPAELARCAGCNYPEPIPQELLGKDWAAVGCGGWMQGLKKIPSSLPCGRENPQHYREYHPEIALLYRTLHEEWARQIEALERIWEAGQ